MFAQIDWVALALSLKLAALTTLFLALTMPFLAWQASFLAQRYQTLLSVFSFMSLALPPSVLGFYALLLLSAEGFIGCFFENGLAFTFSGLLVASIVVNVPFVFSPLLEAVKMQPLAIKEAVLLLNQSRFKAFYCVVWPHLLPTWRVCLCMCFAHCLGEFGLVMMLGGSIPAKTRVFSISIYEQVEQMNYEAAHLNAVLMLAIAFFLAFLAQVVRAR